MRLPVSHEADSMSRRAGHGPKAGRRYRAPLWPPVTRVGAGVSATLRSRSAVQRCGRYRSLRDRRRAVTARDATECFAHAINACRDRPVVRHQLTSRPAVLSWTCEPSWQLVRRHEPDAPRSPQRRRAYGAVFGTDTSERAPRYTGQAWSARGPLRRRSMR